MTPKCSDAFAINSEHPNYYSKHFKHVLEEKKKTFFFFRLTPEPPIRLIWGVRQTWVPSKKCQKSRKSGKIWKIWKSKILKSIFRHCLGLRSGWKWSHSNRMSFLPIYEQKSKNSKTNFFLVKNMVFSGQKWIFIAKWRRKRPNMGKGLTSRSTKTGIHISACQIIAGTRSFEPKVM